MGDPQTPDNQENDLNVVGTAVTPMKRVPILANFEEWMKMATDNKINAANSWNFALIDYFHDMTLLKEGNGVNFQKASCTLDGCVKIYTSRVDSVATETGKLLSGLADSGNKKRSGDGGEDGEGSEGEEEEGEDGVKKRTKKRAQRHAEATLVTSFAQLQLKKMELELAVDPLFKKASADFDEGGAKGLLLNHLAIDGKGRIVFDSSDDVQDASKESRQDSEVITELPEEEEEASQEDVDIDISGLGAKFFPDLARLDEQDICPSLKNFDLGDANASLDIPFLKASEDWRQEQQDKNGKQPEGSDRRRSGIFLDDDNAPGFDDDDGDLGGFDLPPETGFGEGGDAWAKEAAIGPQLRLHRMADSDAEGEANGEEGVGDVASFNPSDNKFAVQLTKAGDDHENILNYFDQALSKNWAGPEHWRIQRIKTASSKLADGPTRRKEKTPFEIDFSAPMTQEIANALYTPASSNSTIQLPKKEWKSRTRNLLPDDKHFNSKQLLRLFLKPKARMGSRRPVQFPGHSTRVKSTKEDAPDAEPDEAFWAQSAPVEEEGQPQGTYDADFFQDDGMGAVGGMDDDEDEFADAREQFSPPVEDGVVPTSIDGVLAQGSEPAQGAFGAQLVTQSRRLRPEYVQYARVAKKVDVRRLKEEIWKEMALDEQVCARRLY